MDPNQRCRPMPARRTPIAAVGAALLIALTQPATADETLGPVTVGAGIQASYYHCDTACIYSPGTPGIPGGTVDGFALDSIRLYINGNVTSQIKLTFNTEYTGSGSGPGANKVEVMDAIGRFEYSSAFNIWAGRFLPPSDRANLYGPYFANDWAPYADAVAGYYPNVAAGRDNGLAYWGDFGMLKVQLGAFDGESLNSAVTDKSKVLGAARVTLDFWDKESGYYLNGTYYGEKNVLALGAAGQTQGGKSTWNIDGLLDRKLGGAGVVTVEAEYQKDNGLTAATPSHGWYVLGSYLFPQVVGVGKFQPLVKYSDKTFHSVVATYPDVGLTPSYKLKTTEVNLNYVIKEFSARVGLYYLDQTRSAVTPTGSAHEFGVKLQLQM